MRQKYVYKRLGENIFKLRKVKDLSQYQLSAIAKINRAYLALIEIGQGNPTVYYVWKIARALKVKMVEVFEGM